MLDPDDLAWQADAGMEPSPAAEGDDDPLILWFLSLTPTERVEVAQDFIASAQLLRDGLRA